MAEVTVKVIKETKDGITIQMDSTIMELPYEYLKQYMDKSLHDPLETLVRNIALNLSLDKTDFTKAKSGEVTTKLDKKVFKVVG